MVISRHPEMYGKETPPPHDLMNPGSGTINSIAVALLAVAVITLAIKEPRCDCENAMPSAAEAELGGLFMNAMAAT